MKNLTFIYKSLRAFMSFIKVIEWEMEEVKAENNFF